MKQKMIIKVFGTRHEEHTVFFGSFWLWKLLRLSLSGMAKFCFILLSIFLWVELDYHLLKRVAHLSLLRTKWRKATKHLRFARRLRSPRKGRNRSARRSARFRIKISCSWAWVFLSVARFLATVICGGCFILKGLKEREALEEFEKDFRTYIEETVADLSSSKW